MGRRVTRADGREKDVSDKRNVVTKKQNKHRFIKFRDLILEIKDNDQNDRKKIITDVSNRQDIRKPGSNPSLHPDGGMGAKKGKIDPDQR